MQYKLFFSFFIFLLLTACADIKTSFIPKKKPQMAHSRLAMTAEKRFWDTFHQGRYDEIPAANRLLMAAFLDNTNDPSLAAHLGFLHIWKISERHREKIIEPTVVDEIILSTNYFSEAVELNPGDARSLGFFGASQLIEGKIFSDQRLQARGYFTLEQAIDDWPEFNYFTGGYVMSTLPPTSTNFKEGLKWQWSVLDLCSGEKINRNNPNFSPYMKLETHKGAKKACWNSWIAPYNFEGFFMNMGDMLVKSGDWQTAIKIYRNATLAKNYSTWPYRAILENKMANAKNNVANFQNDFMGPEKTIMFNSGYGCMACHQQAKKT